MGKNLFQRKSTCSNGQPLFTNANSVVAKWRRYRGHPGCRKQLVIAQCLAVERGPSLRIWERTAGRPLGAALHGRVGTAPGPPSDAAWDAHQERDTLQPSVPATAGGAPT